MYIGVGIFLIVLGAILSFALHASLGAVDLNAVYQHLEIPSEEKFDLVIATNILVYYDVFEQQLALANLEHMLRPGGFLLTNNAMLELPNSSFKGVDYTAVPYSDKHADGDQIFWYQLREKAEPAHENSVK